MAGYIEAICISKEKGMRKKEIAAARFKENWGIESDAHAGTGNRQVSLLAGESIDRVKEKIPDLEKGAFAENLITRGINLDQLQIGEQLAIGDNIILEVTQIGKECHSVCVIKKQTGECIMPTQGIFAKVIQGGKASPGNQIKKLI